MVAESLNALAALAYDAMYMVAQAIETAGTTDRAAIRDAMAGMHYVGVTGDMTLDETGTPAKSVAILTFVEKDGKLVQKFVVLAEVISGQSFTQSVCESAERRFRTPYCQKGLITDDRFSAAGHHRTDGSAACTR